MKERLWATCYGFFVHLERDVNHKRPELRLLVDTDEMLMPLALHLKAGSIQGAIEDALNEGKTNAGRFGLNLNAFSNDPETISFVSDNISGMVSLVLYLCAVNAQIRRSEDPFRRPGMPKSKIVRRGETRFFVAKKQTMWKVGY